MKLKSWIRPAVKLIVTGTYWLPAQLALAEWKMEKAGDAPGFLKDTKVQESIEWGVYLVRVGAGAGAIVFLIGAGNYLRQGQYGRAAGSAMGGIVCATAPWIVTMIQS